MIYFTSDSHFCHAKEFLYGERGFASPQEMNEEIIKRWNEVVQPDDEVYHLGDVVLNDIDAGIDCLNRLNGKIHIIRGNHDTDAKVERYKDCRNVVSIEWSTMLKIGKRYFYLSHFPSITKTPEDAPNKQGIINLHGHTHQTTNFGKDGNFYIYHVGMDSHDLRPVSIEQIIADIAAKRQEYYNNKNI